MEGKIQIEDKKCVLCGKCAAVCNVNAITREGKRMIYDEEKCVSCGRCVKACGFLAISYC
ncbi:MULTISPECIES: 4Fe-4S binding protein [Clostridium]|uniref:4Fe-4S dicluster domain-containing protein n=1 Tax=Clostridium senegalense TaxID=1465809 RepID=A0A6M0H1Y0_9CLOT|nr:MULTISPECIES: 4Fe-4S binding protein [Clostridium]NEU04527.1 4Fe-4S dicluster domain-containing protein [Clostridium senegalense]